MAILVVVASVTAYDHLARSRVKPSPLAPHRSLETDDRNRYHDRAFRVIRVLDGDTLDINAPDGEHLVTRIRLWGVDAPELGHGAGSEPFAVEATEFARRTLSGRDVHLVLSPSQTRDRFGRLLAYVFLERGGTMFNELLIEGGYARADARFPHHYDDRFKAAERRARRLPAGLWAAAASAEQAAAMPSP
jgi:micrococcal nuclease